ncbi:glycosyltransferase family 2 protein [Priestia endophytica]|uniref:glycosyltransferase family 2 protein n=1 Tax=Priestia endophytica TaxID=135735 RepID=UPI000DCA960D|nr:glycosyltransferase family 2 protein [Priestia endophytica]RAS79922.1 hypothetical protein A4U60_14665 [Priestia endophytica]
MDELVSIIVPIYKVEKYIQRCIDSLTNQTFSNIEIILVDDGSPDNCPTICDDYANVDSRIKVIHKENGGLSDARNAGMEEATGKYIIFIDGDDYVELNMVEKAIEAAQLSKSNVVIWGFYADYVDDNEILIKSVVHQHESGVFRRNEYKNIVIGKHLIGNLGYAWNKMYELSFLKENNFKFTKGLSLVEDIVFNSPVLSQSEKITFLDEPLIHYMQRPRITLGTKFYEDYFEIKKLAISSVENLLRAWGQDNEKISNIMASLVYMSLKTTVSQLSKANNLSKSSKKVYLDKVLYDSITIKIKDKVKFTSLKDKGIYQLMKFKKSNALLLFYKLLQR